MSMRYDFYLRDLILFVPSLGITMVTQLLFYYLDILIARHQILHLGAYKWPLNAGLRFSRKAGLPKYLQVVK